MGGELRECGCYDGPWSAEDPVPTSLRCDAHRQEPPLPGYQLGFRNGARGRVSWPLSTTTRVPRMAIPRGRSRR